MTAKERRYKDKIAQKQYFVKHMDNIGLSRKYTGYFQIVDIMHLLINEKIKVVSFSRQIYPIIAKMYNSNATTIERNVRNLINKCWDNNIKHNLSAYWDIQKRPSCCQFIYLIKNYIIDQFS